jgi:hypothetical protein
LEPGRGLFPSESKRLQKGKSEYERWKIAWFVLNQLWSLIAKSYKVPHYFTLSASFWNGGVDKVR